MTKFEEGLFLYGVSHVPIPWDATAFQIFVILFLCLYSLI